MDVFFSVVVLVLGIIVTILIFQKQMIYVNREVNQMLFTVEINQAGQIQNHIKELLLKDHVLIDLLHIILLKGGV